MGRFVLQRFASDDALARQAAELWVGEVGAAARRGERHLVALSGGRIAAKFFAATVAVARQQCVNFGHVHFFWTDERCLPPDHPESNFATANRLLLQPLGIRLAQMHRLQGEEGDAAAVAAGSAGLRGLAPLNAAGQPVLDLVLLGMGEDGHVASLFPNEAQAAADSAEVYRAVVAVKPPPRRLTLGYGAIVAARSAWVLASGPGKETALRESLSPGERTPLGRVLDRRSSTLILTDIATA